MAIFFYYKNTNDIIIVMLKSIIFTEEGEFDVINKDLYNGKNYFRKMSKSPQELMIAKILIYFGAQRAVICCQ